MVSMESQRGLTLFFNLKWMAEVGRTFCRVLGDAVALGV
jgi:hypothetical protein